MSQVYAVDMRGRVAPLPVSANSASETSHWRDAHRPPSGALSSTPHQSWRVLIVTSLITFMVSLEITVIALAFQDLQAAFPSAAGTTLSWIVTGYNISVASFLLLAGWWADRGGRKLVFLIGVATFAIASALATIAPTHEFLIFARCIQGLGGAMIFPAGLALLLREFSCSRRDLALGVWGATGALAAAVGPSVGGLLVEIFGWRSVFAINVPVALLVLLLGALWLDESRAPSERASGRIDMLGMPTAAAGVGLIVLAIANTNRWGWFTTSTVVTLAAGAALVGFFVVRSRRHARPIFRFELFELDSYRWGNAMTMLFTVAFFAWLIVTPTFFQQAWGWSVARTGFAMAPAPMLAMLTSPLAGALGARFGNRRIVAIGGFIASIGVLAHLFLTTTEPSYITGFLIPGSLLGVGVGLSFAPAVAATLRDVAPSEFGMASAGRTTLFQLAVAIAVAVAIAIYTADPGLDSMRLLWMLIAGAFFLQAVVAIVSYPLGATGGQAVAGPRVDRPVAAAPVRSVAADPPSAALELYVPDADPDPVVAGGLRPDELRFAMTPVR